MSKNRPPKPEDIASYPRTEKKKVPHQPKVIQKDIDPNSEISETIPENIKIAVASAIMAFSEMEMSAEFFIWDVLKLSHDDGKLLTQIDAKDKFQLAKKLSERYAVRIHPNSNTAINIWASIGTILEARNKIAHGVWRMKDKSIPIIFSIRMKTEPGSINSEHFPLDRLEAIADTSSKIKRYFDAMCTMISSLQQKPLPQPSPLSSQSRLR